MVRTCIWIESNFIWNSLIGVWSPNFGAAWNQPKRHPQPEEIISCYKNLVAAVYNKLGCTLVLSRKIVWTNVPDEIHRKYNASITIEIFKIYRLQLHLTRLLGLIFRLVVRLTAQISIQRWSIVEAVSKMSHNISLECNYTHARGGGCRKIHYAEVLIMSGDNVSQLFNVWAQNGRSDTMATGHENAVKFMLSRLGSLEGRRFLDVGCNGWVVRRVAEQACDCAVGIDIAPQMIRVAQERRQRETETYIVGDFCDYSFKQRFDIIFSMESIYYVDELSLALNRRTRC